jgi:presenilin-like A22 family membrane protease
MKTMWIKSRSAKQQSHLIRVVFSLISSLLLALSEGEKSYSTIFLTPDYFRTLLINAMMVFLLVSVIYKITYALDCYETTDNSYKKRVRNQFFWGILFPILPAIVITTVYFAYNDINILQTTHFIRFLQRIILLVIILNFYLFYHTHKQNKQNDLRNALYLIIQTFCQQAMRNLDIALGQKRRILSSILIMKKLLILPWKSNALIILPLIRITFCIAE